MKLFYIGSKSALNNGSGLIPLLPMVCNVEWGAADSVGVDFIDNKVSEEIVREAELMVRIVDEGTLCGNSSWTYIQEIQKKEVGVNPSPLLTVKEKNSEVSVSSFPVNEILALSSALSSNSHTIKTGTSFCDIRFGHKNITRAIASRLSRCVHPLLTEVFLSFITPIDFHVIFFRCHIHYRTPFLRLYPFRCE
jgi:hypothetical protein